jgi:transcription antitermination factor NusG
MTSLRWYVLKSKPNKEVLLYKQLLTREFEVYFPYLDIKPVNPRSRTTKPYFPGYMFVRVALDEVGLSTFQWMPYAVGLVSFDKEPATIENDVMQTLIKKIEFLKQIKDNRSLPFEPGNTLLVNRGPFAGYEAIFDTSLPGRDRVRILLMMVQNNQISVELPTSHVQLKE